MASDVRSGLEVIDHDRCLQLLRGGAVGRVAVISGGGPMIFPVNYTMDGEDVVFRTGQGTKLDSGPRARACFEIDGIDPITCSGWSVVVSGRLEEVTAYDSPAWQRLTALDLEPWAAGRREHWMRVVPTFVTGRRIPPSPAAS